MSYVVLARRYRPQTFSDIVGQAPIVKTLGNAIRSDRVAHAYLFAGPRGVGKTSTARILSKALNCIKGPTDTPCNVCDICRSISEGSDIDVLEIDGASNRGIDEIRNIRQNVGFAPSRARYRIYIIDEVHMLTREAFNALLKTLEEPPSHVKFIFATTAVNRLPETVQSRCQRFDFKNISVQGIEKHLSEICKTEGKEIEPAALHTIARSAKGGLRDSQSVLDQLLSFCNDKVTSADVNYVLGYIDEDKIHGMFECFVKRDPSGSLEIVDDILNEGKTPMELIDQLLLRLRDLLVFSSCGQDAAWIEFDEPFVERFGKSFSADTLMYMIQMLSMTRMRSTDSLLQRIATEMVVIKLCKMESLRSLSDLVERIALLEDKLEQVANNPGKRNNNDIIHSVDSSSQQAVMGKPIEEGDVINPVKEEREISGNAIDKKDVWEKILKNIQHKKKSTWALFREGRFVSCESGVLVVEFPRNYSFHKQKLDQPEEKKIIEDCVKEAVREVIEVRLVVSENGRHEENSQGQSSGDDGGAQQTDDIVFSDPAVKKTLELFDGRVIKVNR
ncbi:MAG: DNA polymerase III subunit gamma/tau [Candidatus Kuenenia sp.]|nr:DNA polymerase III subunit gamma/tau [Candidatus Kuenenia hertensis]